MFFPYGMEGLIEAGAGSGSVKEAVGSTSGVVTGVIVPQDSKTSKRRAIHRNEDLRMVRTIISNLFPAIDGRLLLREVW